MTKINPVVGTPLGSHPTRVLLLGSGELGKEVAIALSRLGVWVCAADSYDGAPAQQVAQAHEAIDMTDATALADLIARVKPDIIVPEVEAIATDVLKDAQDHGVRVVPSAGIAATCMDREALRTLAAQELGLPTSDYRFAGSLDELKQAAAQVGFPCVVKPRMSSSGHGQSVVRDAGQLEQAWQEAQEGRRGAGDGTVSRVIVERLVDLDYELTMLTVSSVAGIVTCAPIGQRQEDGDYRDSWQPARVDPEILDEARRIARDAVAGLVAHAGTDTPWGVFGVELFVLKDGRVLFNEVSPRPHDTGMVTMASQRLSEFDLHARAMLGLPVKEGHVALSIGKFEGAASHAIVVEGYGEAEFADLDEALATPGTDLRVFAKPRVEGRRRMGVALAVGSDVEEARIKAVQVAQALRIQVV
ncbi:formate-dependent phosphoribosylglycinamide formyltransferase [Bifidobacterium cuniculi]|uniref:Formate-dependent phosphoribosylglycinamide formyltransferase n=1 Tax=Bifidobacterium cuniculi TaxID=1688 RepID=A0A087AX11_9BIFI|nr:formate-dependent phosphoribosylglycinamide formyltransferase [Bifidobacterium cuniculi]KFI63311.1 phosphoribosylglycinamide formyltransferase 2 [Bifidobacterium cuniculi]